MSFGFSPLEELGEQETVNSSTFKEQRREDLFDRLPDSVVYLIFNKVLDAKSLCLSMSVCKRFYSIIPEVDTVFLSMRRESKQNQQNPIAEKAREVKKLFKNFVGEVSGIPLSLFVDYSDQTQNIVVFFIMMLDMLSTVPGEALKAFRGIRNLELNVPCSDFDIDSSLLMWKAEFGGELQNCLVLCAREISKIDESHEICSRDDDDDDDDVESECLLESSEQFAQFSDDDMTSTLWIIACLTVACSWHRLSRETLKVHRTLQNLMIRDERKLGAFTMNCERIEEFKKSTDFKNSADTKLPLLRMKMRYVPELKLSGCVMRGATLVVIKPVEGWNEAEESGDWMVEAFDREGKEGKVYGEAVRKLSKNKTCYTLESKNIRFDLF